MVAGRARRGGLVESLAWGERAAASGYGFTVSYTGVKRKLKKAEVS